jgi:hypothetical protein
MDNLTNEKGEESKQNLLLNQRNAQEQINNLLEQSTQALLCGPDCQKQKVSDELKKKYLKAQTNLKTAPINLEITKKNYYVYTEGEPSYDNMLESELKEKSEIIGELIGISFNDELTSAETMNKYYSTAVINSNYTKDLLIEYDKKNKELKLQLRDRRGDILTNDRKTYYENDALDRLKLWHRFWWYIYYLLVLVFLISIFLVKSQMTILKKIVITALLIFYPYYIEFIVNCIYEFFSNIYKNLPKNVYNNL